MSAPAPLLGGEADIRWPARSNRLYEYAPGYAGLTDSLDCLTPHAMNRSILIANFWWLAD
ncbi:hypothetical protein AB7M47_007692 [Bradyrhizobium elkanii]|nr:hypothetical protein QIH80_31205 [Bradyrhizobium elkanii]